MAPRSVASVFVVLALAGCGGSSGSEAAPQPANVTTTVAETTTTTEGMASVAAKLEQHCDAALESLIGELSVESWAGLAKMELGVDFDWQPVVEFDDSGVVVDNATACVIGFSDDDGLDVGFFSDLLDLSLVDQQRLRELGYGDELVLPGNGLVMEFQSSRSDGIDIFVERVQPGD